MRTRLFVSLLLIALAAAVVQPLTTQAEGTAENTEWGIVAVPNVDPTITANGYFVYPMQPDTRVSGQILVRNPGLTPVTVDLTTVTAETAQTGGSAFALESGAVGGVAGWIELGQQQATVDPGMEQTVSFSVQTPAGVKPGQYLAGIAASEAPSATGEGTAAKANLGASVTTQTRYVIGVQADIAGTWQASLTIPTVNVLDQPSGTVVGVQLSNDGDIFLKPFGTIRVTDAAGTQLISQQIEMGTFVPGTAVTYPIRWPGTPAAGTYGVAVDLEYAEGKHALYNSTFDVSGAVEQHAVERANAQVAAQPVASVVPAAAIQPWMFYVVGGLLVLIVLLLLLILLRGRKTVRNT